MSKTIGTAQNMRMTKKESVPPSRKRRKNLTAKIIFGLINLLVAVWILWPLLNVLHAALIVPDGITVWDNFLSVFDRVSANAKGKILVPAIGNSVFIAIALVAINLVLAATGGYGLSRYRSAGTHSFYVSVLVARIIPALAIVGPFLVLFRIAGLTNTPWALIISYISFTIPLALLTMRNYFDQLPLEIEEAAYVDGATRWSTFYSITLPIALPGLGATAILVFLEAWSEFFYAQVLTDRLTITPVLASFQSAQNFDWNGLAAATLVTMAPPVLLAIIFQRTIVGSLAAGYDR